MPIYDYVCSSCQHRVEVIHGIHDAGPRFCPNCGTEGSMRKAPATPAIHFKGSGWAKKDRSSTSGAPKKGSAASSNDGKGAKAGSGSSSTSAASSGSEGAGSGSASSSSED